MFKKTMIPIPEFINMNKSNEKYFLKYTNSKEVADIKMKF